MSRPNDYPNRDTFKTEPADGVPVCPASLSEPASLHESGGHGMCPVCASVVTCSERDGVMTLDPHGAGRIFRFLDVGHREPECPDCGSDAILANVADTLRRCHHCGREWETLEGFWARKFPGLRCKYSDADDDVIAAEEVAEDLVTAALDDGRWEGVEAWAIQDRALDFLTAHRVAVREVG